MPSPYIFIIDKTSFSKSVFDDLIEAGSKSLVKLPPELSSPPGQPPLNQHQCFPSTASLSAGLSSDVSCTFYQVSFTQFQGSDNFILLTIPAWAR